MNISQKCIETEWKIKTAKKIEKIRRHTTLGLVPIDPVVSEKKIKMWKFTDDDWRQMMAIIHMVC
jgi:hypothetical protein